MKTVHPNDIGYRKYSCRLVSISEHNWCKIPSFHACRCSPMMQRGRNNTVNRATLLYCQTVCYGQENHNMACISAFWQMLDNAATALFISCYKPVLIAVYSNVETGLQWTTIIMDTDHLLLVCKPRSARHRCTTAWLGEASKTDETISPTEVHPIPLFSPPSCLIKRGARCWSQAKRYTRA